MSGWSLDQTWQTDKAGAEAGQESSVRTVHKTKNSNSTKGSRGRRKFPAHLSPAAPQLGSPEALLYQQDLSRNTPRIDNQKRVLCISRALHIKGFFHIRILSFVFCLFIFPPTEQTN